MENEKLPWDTADSPAPQAENRTEVTIKFGKGLVGETFTSKAGSELVRVSIPNPDAADKRPWETFVISPKMIHDNKFGKGVWMKLPEDGTTKLSRSVHDGIDEAGRTIWRTDTREVLNTELKALMESYKEKNKDSVLGALSDQKENPAVAPHSAKQAKRKKPEASR